MGGGINKRRVEDVIVGGGFERFGNRRGGMMNVYERMIDSGVKENKDGI